MKPVVLLTIVFMWAVTISMLVQKDWEPPEGAVSQAAPITPIHHNCIAAPDDKPYYPDCCYYWNPDAETEPTCHYDAYGRSYIERHPL